MNKTRKDYMEDWHWCHTFPNYLERLGRDFNDSLENIFVGLFVFLFSVIKIPLIFFGLIKEFPLRLIADIFKWGYYKKSSQKVNTKTNSVVEE